MNDSMRMDRVRRFIETLNQGRELGLTVISAKQGQLTLCLPYSDRIIGNPDTGVIHVDNHLANQQASARLARAREVNAYEVA